MGFKNTFIVSTKSEGKALEFFGFECSVETQTHYVKRDDTYEITYEGDDKATVRKVSGGYSTRESKLVKWERKFEPSDEESILEDKFYGRIKGTKIGRDFPKKPKLCPRASRFYVDYCVKKLHILLWLLLLDFIFAASRVVSVFQNVSFGDVSGNVMSTYAVMLIGCVSIALSVFFLTFFLGLFLVLGLNIILKIIFEAIFAKKYDKLSEEKKAKIGEKYLKSLTVRDEEADKILREYAILKGYDKK